MLCRIAGLSIGFAVACGFDSSGKGNGAGSSDDSSTSVGSGATTTTTMATTTTTGTGTTTTPATASVTTDATSGSTTEAATTTGAPMGFGPWAQPTKVEEIDLNGGEDDPTLTRDQLEMYYARSDGAERIHVTKRASVEDPWGAPEQVMEVSGGPAEGTPELGGDGLVMTFSRDPNGMNTAADIFVTTRSSRRDPWGQPQRVGELSSNRLDVAAAPSWDLDRIVLCSRRRDAASFLTDLFEVDVDFAMETYGQVRLLEGLATGGRECAPHMTPDGLTIFFDSDRPDAEAQHDLWTATRPDMESPFEAPEPIMELNTDDGETDPWISFDRRTLYFTRSADPDAIYFTTREPL